MTATFTLVLKDNHTPVEDTIDNMMNKNDNVSSTDLMYFIISFKDTVKKAMEGVRKEINSKLDEILSNLDKGLANLTNEVKNNDKKQAKENMKVDKRMQLIEQDLQRIKFSRMKSSTLSSRDEPNCSSNNQPVGRNYSDCQLDTEVQSISRQQLQTSSQQLIARQTSSQQPIAMV